VPGHVIGAPAQRSTVCGALEDLSLRSRRGRDDQASEPLRTPGSARVMPHGPIVVADSRVSNPHYVSFDELVAADLVGPSLVDAAAVGAAGLSLLVVHAAVSAANHHFSRSGSCRHSRQAAVLGQDSGDD
jgi:hypothetical protein